MTPDQANPKAWENVALAVLEQLGRPASPVDLAHLALSLGICLGPTVTADGGASAHMALANPDCAPRVFRRRLARSLARWALREHEQAESTAAIEAVAHALLHPPYERPSVPASVIQLAARRPSARR